MYTHERGVRWFASFYHERHCDLFANGIKFAPTVCACKFIGVNLATSSRSFVQRGIFLCERRENFSSHPLVGSRVRENGRNLQRRGTQREFRWKIVVRRPRVQVQRLVALTWFMVAAEPVSLVPSLTIIFIERAALLSPEGLIYFLYSSICLLRLLGVNNSNQRRTVIPRRKFRPAVLNFDSYVTVLSFTRSTCGVCRCKRENCWNGKVVRVIEIHTLTKVM